MLSKYFYRARLLARQLWVRVALISFLAVLAAALAPILTPFMPEKFLVRIKLDTVRSLLDILANSMLAVTTFSLTIMVTAHLMASQQATPRAHRVLREDKSTQTVLATFVGAFVFSLTSIVLLQLGMIGEGAFALIYISTLFVLGLVIVAILRWVGHLASLGSVEETTRKVHQAASDVLKRRLENPFLGGRPMSSSGVIPETAHDIASPRTGFVQHIDTVRLSECAGALNAHLFVAAMPGDWVGEGDPLGSISITDMTDADEKNLRDCYSIGDDRTFAQDAIFGVSVLTEIAERALSPSTNDPKTAADIIARLVLVFEALGIETVEDEPDAPNVFVPALDVELMLETGFDPIARDGKGFVEIQLHLQRALARLSRHRHTVIADKAKHLASRALAWADIGLPLEDDRARVRSASVAERPAKLADHSEV
jgi:uncharacterized membrane protein